jgi:hypothetical protein
MHWPAPQISIHPNLPPGYLLACGPWWKVRKSGLVFAGEAPVSFSPREPSLSIDPGEKPMDQL